MQDPTDQYVQVQRENVQQTYNLQKEAYAFCHEDNMYIVFLLSFFLQKIIFLISTNQICF